MSEANERSQEVADFLFSMKDFMAGFALNRGNKAHNIVLSTIPMRILEASECAISQPPKKMTKEQSLVVVALEQNEGKDFLRLGAIFDGNVQEGDQQFLQDFIERTKQWIGEGFTLLSSQPISELEPDDDLDYLQFPGRHTKRTSGNNGNGMGNTRT